MSPSPSPSPRFSGAIQMIAIRGPRRCDAFRSNHYSPAAMSMLDENGLTVCTTLGKATGRVPLRVGTS